MAHHSHLRTHRALDTIQARENPKIDIYDTHVPVDSPFPATPTMAPTSTGNFHRPVGTGPSARPPVRPSVTARSSVRLLVSLLQLVLRMRRSHWSYA